MRPPVSLSLSLSLSLSAALKRFNGLDHFEKERADMESERVLALGIRAKKPWELFKDRSVRWQLLTIFVMNSAQQLNGINAVRPNQQHSTYRYVL